MKKLLDTSTSNKRGNLKHNKREFHDVIFSSLVDTPSPDTIATPSKLSKFKRSLQAPLLAEVLDMPRRTVSRKLIQAVSKRSKLKGQSTSTTYASISRRRGFSRITPEVKQAVRDWILKHDSVKMASSSKDVIKVKIDGMEEKQHIQKCTCRFLYQKCMLNSLNQLPRVVL